MHCNGLSALKLRMFLLAYLCALTCLSVCHGYPAQKTMQVQNTQSTLTMPEYTTGRSMIRTRPDVKNHEGIFKQCAYFPTRRLRQLCERIAENPIIVAMKNHAHGEVKAVPFHRVQKSDMPLAAQQGLKCPDYSGYLNNYVKPHDRSLSPWKMVSQYDKLRYPQWIPMATCLCKGCIDQTTGKENTSFISQEIKVKVRFLRMNSTYTSFRQCTDRTCYPSDEDISVGCHCAIPVQIDP